MTAYLTGNLKYNPCDELSLYKQEVLIMVDDYCQHCWRPTSMGGHNEGCPTALGTSEAMATWENGRDYGWDDNIIHSWNFRFYPKTYILGYRVGKAAMDELVEAAVQTNIGYHSGEF
jgi:hypothetical protein